MSEYEEPLRGPFGRPDGTSLDFREVAAEYLEFPTSYGGIALRDSDSSVRVIFGKMGAGKSVQLRRLQDYTDRHNKSVYTVRNGQPLRVFTTDHVVRFSQLFAASDLTEWWQLLWAKALARSVISYIVQEPGLRARAADEAPESLERLLNHYRGRAPLLGQKPTHGRSLANQAAAIIDDRATTAATMKAYLHDSRWEDLEHDLRSVLAFEPSIFIYIDAIDDEFKAAPSYWLRAQKGLFYQIMQLRREETFRSKVHLVAAFRDIVLTSVYLSEHGARYRDPESICILNWDEDSLAEFLLKKVQNLDASEYADPTRPGTIEGWLGVSGLNNRRKGDAWEDIGSYLIRHTRCIPRDVVSLGNDLCAEARAVRAQGRAGLTEIEIRRIVHMSARRSASFQFANCANKIASDMMPSRAVEQGYSESYMGADEDRVTHWTDALLSVVATVPEDYLSGDALEWLKDEGRKRFGPNIDVASCLWQHGLLGCVDTDLHGNQRALFYSVADIGGFNLPASQFDRFALHPIVIDLITSVTPVGLPVRPSYKPK
jgi:hypothetical protein